jgi:chromate reductase, NAD(P)H dehydrogenase (quinone)
VPLRGKSAVLLAASPGPFGGIRGLWQLRIPLEGLGMVVLPDMFALANAAKAFEPGGELTDPSTGERLAKLLDTYLDVAGKLSGNVSGKT